MLPESLTPSNEPTFTDQTGLSDALELIESCNVSPVDALPFDPERLYQREQERDEAFEELCRALPAEASVTVSYLRAVRKVGGKVEPLEGAFVAIVYADGVSVTTTDADGGKCIASALREWNVKREVARRLSDAALSA